MKLNKEENNMIYDDTSSGDDFYISKILYENSDIFVAEVENEWYDDNITVMVYKESRVVVSKDLEFYLWNNFVE